MVIRRCGDQRYLFDVRSLFLIQLESSAGEGVGSKSASSGLGYWTTNEVLANTISYSDYIQIRAPVYISHSAGRYAQKRFRKAQCPIIERLTNSLMMKGRNNGKKLMAVRIVAHAFEIVR